MIYGAVKKRKALRPVEYRPPRGLSPADVAIEYYGRRMNTHVLFNALMLYWADNGFVKIEDDCRRGLKLTKLKPLEPPQYENAAARTYKYEKRLFDEMFKDGDVFYTLAAKSGYRKENEKFTEDCAAAAKRVNTALSNRLRTAACALAVAAAAAVTIILALNFSAADRAVFMTMIFPIGAVLANKVLPPRLYMKYPLLIMFAIVPLGALLYTVPVAYSITLCAAVGAELLTVGLISERIDIRTPSDLELYGRICAFAEFLTDAEIDKLETLVEEDPDYFYGILPYCYILELTDKLRSKFDRIALDGPAWYLVDPSGDLRDVLMS